MRRDREANLTSDLKLDSLARVALITQLEDRFQLDLDESQVTAALTLGDLESLLLRSDRLPEASQPEAARPTPGTGGESPAPSASQPDPSRSRPDAGTSVTAWRPYPYPHWALRRPAAWIRFLFQHGLIWPLTHLLCWTPGGWTKTLARTSGARAGDRQPRDLFRSGPHPLLPALSLQEPVGHRHDRRKAEGLSIPAARARAFRFTDTLAYGVTAGGFNAFPLPKQSGFRRSFDYAGEAMDRGYSVMVFPEGARTKDGEIQPFQSGIGLLAAGLGARSSPPGSKDCMS